MSKKMSESTKIAEDIIKSKKYGYLYGAKDIEYTRDNVDKLDKVHKYSPSVKKQAYANCKKYERAIDCSGFVCKVLGIPHYGSYQIKDNAYKCIGAKNNKPVDGNLLWRQGHIAYVGAVAGMLYIYEARSTFAGLTKTVCTTKEMSRFTHILDCGLSEPDGDNTKYFAKLANDTKSIVDALKSVGASSDIDYRKKIAKANGLSKYVGGYADNVKMLRLMRDGKLKKP